MEDKYKSGLIIGLRPANETALPCNNGSHWMGANLEAALQMDDAMCWKIIR